MSGYDFDLDAARVPDVVGAMEPEPIQEHYAVVGGRCYPPKQVLAAVTGLDRADFTTRQARSILRRLGFGVHRRGADHGGSTAVRAGPQSRQRPIVARQRVTRRSTHDTCMAPGEVVPAPP